MTTTIAQDLNRRRRIGDAIAELRLIDCADIRALDDATLTAFNTAIWAVAAYSDIEIDLRRWQCRDAVTLHETTDTQWPDALEAAA